MRLRGILQLWVLVTVAVVGCKQRADNLQSGLRGDGSGGGEPPVIIVGAGLTGLTTAYELQKAGIKSLVLEAAEKPGGRIETITYSDGATAEAHMEEYWERSPAYPLLRELGLELMEDVAHSSVRLDNKIYVYKGEGDRDEYLAGIFTPEEQKAFLAWNDKTWQLYEELHGTHFSGKPLTPKLEELTKISFKDYVMRFNLPRKVSEWIRVTLEPEMAIEWEKVAALDGIDEMRLFLDSPEGFGEKNYHVKGGNTNFINALVKRLPANTVRTESRVTSVESLDDNGDGVDDRVLVTYTNDDGEATTVRGQYAVITVPLYVLDKIKITPPLSQDRQKAIKTTKFGSYIKIHYRVKPEVKKTWESYGDSLFTFLTDSEVGSVYNATGFEEQLSEGHDMIFTLLIHARFAKPLLKLDDPDDMGEVSAENMNKLLPGFSELITDTKVYPYPTAVAYWPLAEGRSRFDRLAEELRKPHGVSKTQGRIWIGGDTTENSHSEGAVQAANRIAAEITARDAAR